jgi:hypothetical protein
MHAAYCRIDLGECPFTDRKSRGIVRGGAFIGNDKGDTKLNKEVFMLKLTCFAASTCLVALAQAQTTQAPKPGPEVQRLGYIVGKWNCEDAAKAKPATKLAGRMECQWYTGGFFVVCRSHSTTPTATESDIVYVTGYNPEEKAYTMYRYGSTGDASLRKGSRDGTTWTYSWDRTPGGKPTKFQVRMTEDSPVSVSTLFRRSVEGGPWTVLAEGKCTKTE